MLPVYGVKQQHNGVTEKRKRMVVVLQYMESTSHCGALCVFVVVLYTVRVHGAVTAAAVSAPPCWFAHANEGALNHQVLKVKFLSYHIHEWGPHSQTYICTAYIIYDTEHEGPQTQYDI